MLHRHGNTRRSTRQLSPIAARSPGLFPLQDGPLAPLLTPILGGGTATVTAVQTTTVPGATPSQSPNADPGASPPQAGDENPPTASESISNESPQQSGSPSSPGNPANPGSPAASGTGTFSNINALLASGSASSSALSSAATQNGDPSKPMSAGSKISSSMPKGGQNGSAGTNSDGSPADPNSPGNAGSNIQGHKTSSGAVAGLASAFIIALIILIFILRRRAQLRRGDRSRRWRFGGAGSDGGEANLRGSGERGLSMRSSFGTNLGTCLDFPGSLAFPPLESPPPSSLDPGFEAIAALPVAHLNRDTSYRHSIGSLEGDECDCLPTPTSSRGAEDSLISVSPFSPSESFAFPRPPLGSFAQKIPLLREQHPHVLHLLLDGDKPKLGVPHNTYDVPQSVL